MGSNQILVSFTKKILLRTDTVASTIREDGDCDGSGVGVGVGVGAGAGVGMGFTRSNSIKSGMGTSSVGKLTTSFGGVARNIAEGLSRLGLNDGMATQENIE